MWIGVLAKGACDLAMGKYPTSAPGMGRAELLCATLTAGDMDFSAHLSNGAKRRRSHPLKFCESDIASPATRTWFAIPALRRLTQRDGIRISRRSRRDAESGAPLECVQGNGPLGSPFKMVSESSREAHLSTV
jgi:hypothetical protein